MKKILSTIFIGLLCLSMFPMFAPHVKAESAYLTDIVRLTPNPYDDRGAGWSPDSSKIAYGAFADSWYRHIWVMNRDGSDKTQLTFGNVVDEGPDYSPDGSKIAFTRYGLRGWGIHDIFIMNADGSGTPEQITSTGLARLNVKWSNDGQRLAFYYGGAGTTTNEIHIMNIDGTNEVTVASGTYPVMNAYWSPDDTKLVYSMDDGIWVVDTSPPYQKTRVFQTSLPTMYAVYSPDGNYIMYASGMYGQLQNLYLIDVSGNFIAQLTYDTKFGYGFDWSPDGQYIAFNSISSGNYDIWRADISIQHTPTKWAVILGDNEYKNSADNGRGGPVNSANDIYGLLINKFNFPPANVHFRTDAVGNSADDINTIDVENELNWLIRNVNPGDTAIFYYAGHGFQGTGGIEYLIAHDEIGLSDLAFAGYINKIETDKLLVILDMSFSGGFITDGQTFWQGISGTIPSWTDLAKGTPNGRIVLTACAQNVTLPALASLPSRIPNSIRLPRDAKETLYWSPSTGLRYEMIFTHCLTMGFRGSGDSNGDGKVTVEEAFKFAQTGSFFSQTPLMYDGYPAYGSSGDLYLG